MTKKLITSLIIVLVFAGVAFAENPDLKNKWNDLCKALDKDEGISDETKDALKDFSAELMKEGEGADLSSGDMGKKVDEWFKTSKRREAADRFFGTNSQRGLLERLTLYGDFRYRFEAQVKPDTHNRRYNSDEDASCSAVPNCVEEHDEQLLQSARLRIGLVLNIEEDLLDFGARLTTGDPSEQHDEDDFFDNNFGKLNANWDRAYLHYTPYSEKRPFRLLGWADLTTDFYIGKFDHNWLFVSAGTTWDSVVQPTGFGGLFTIKNMSCNPLFDEGFFGLALYQMTEEQYNEDATIFVAQAGMRKGFKWGEHTFDFTLATAIYDVNDPDNDCNGSSIIGHGSGLGDNGYYNDGNNFVSEFQIIENYFQLDFSGFNILGKKRPMSLVIGLTHNTSAHGDPEHINHRSTDVDDGLSITLTLGELEKKGDWQLGWYYGNFERDSLFTPVSTTEVGDGSNCIENVFWIEYMVLDKTSLMLWYAFGQQRIDDSCESIGEDDHMNGIFRLELNVEF